MQGLLSEWEATSRLAIAAVVGLGVGLEREWSGHTTGPNARFAGLRTFLLLGALGGGAGLLLTREYLIAGAATIAGGLALCVAAYVASSHRLTSDVDGTTEAAALVVILLGALAGVGWLALAAGAGSLIVLALSEKTRLHWLVQRLSEAELHATLRFAVLALVVLPLLPTGPFGGLLAIRPRSLWTVVLFFCALNFAGFLARRAVGAGAGIVGTGMLGGLVSSTGVTLEFARKSRNEPALGTALAYGVVGACTVLIPRIVVVSAVLNPAAAIRIAAILVVPAICGGIIVWRGYSGVRKATASVTQTESPLRVTAAIKMTLAFQISMTAIAIASRWGTAGLYSTAAALGLTDMDALTVSMSRADGGISADLAAQAIAIGVVANTALKLTLSAVIGAGPFRRVAVGSLAIQALATLIGLALVSRVF
ncbi:MAG TPA: MgtC/SapB family protein [Gemmatimonadaceae bacterium]